MRRLLQRRILVVSIFVLAALVSCAPAPIASSSSDTWTAGETTSATLGTFPDGFRVIVPRLDIDLPVLEGDLSRDIDRQHTPEGAAFHLPGTGLPGAGSNTYLYAHARTGMFLSLWDARVGDEVVIATPDGRRLDYVVVEIRPRVASDDVSVTQPTRRERLTLQTSTGPRPNDPRFVVIAEPPR